MLTNQQEKDRAAQLKKMSLNFKKARLATKHDKYTTEMSGYITLIVPDKDDVEVPYMCAIKDVPEEAKHLLKEEKEAKK